MSDEKKIESPSDFARWRAAMGFKGNEVVKAAEAIGVKGATTASELHRGHNDPSETERLAMSAARAGLPAWTPEADSQVAEISKLKGLVEKMSRRLFATAREN